MPVDPRDLSPLGPNTLMKVDPDTHALYCLLCSWVVDGDAPDDREEANALAQATALMHLARHHADRWPEIGFGRSAAQQVDHLTAALTAAGYDPTQDPFR